MPTAAELKEEGLAFFRADNLPEAANRFSEAADRFAVDGQAQQSAEARNNLCVVRLAQEDWAGALAAVTGTPEVFQAAGDPMRQAQALSNLAAAQAGAGELDQAAQLYERAIDVFRDLGENENRAACWKALSGVQIKQDKKLQAMASMQAGLNLAPTLTKREKTLKGLLDRASKMMLGH
jgi:tetratricopeptide (TPR) repeat protein